MLMFQNVAGTSFVIIGTYATRPTTNLLESHLKKKLTVLSHKDGVMQAASDGRHSVSAGHGYPDRRQAAYFQTGVTVRVCGRAVSLVLNISSAVFVCQNNMPLWNTNTITSFLQAHSMSWATFGTVYAHY